MTRSKKPVYQIPGTNANKDRIYPILNPISEAPIEGKEYMNNRRSCIKTTAESIVREHRDAVTRRERDLPTPNGLRRAGAEIFKPYPVTIQPPKIAWFQKINWEVVLEWGCWILAAICLMYIGIFLVAPFGVKLGILNEALRPK